MSEAKKGALNLVYFFQNPRISPSQAALASITNMGMGGGIASEVRQILVYKWQFWDIQFCIYWFGHQQSIRVISSKEYRRVSGGVVFTQEDDPAVITTDTFFILGQPKETDIVLRDTSGQLLKFVHPKKENSRWNDWQWVHDLNYWRYRRIWYQNSKKTQWI